MLEKLQQLLSNAKQLKINSEKYIDGYIDGIQDALKILKKYTYGGTKQTAGPRQPITELVDLQESELRPAVKFLSQPSQELIGKIAEEFGEVLDANGEYIGSGHSKHLAEELVDLQMACETMLAKLWPDVKDRREIRKSVIHKNTNRGYYGEEKKS